MIEGQRSPVDPEIILILLILVLASRITLLQGYATAADNPTTGNTKENAKPKMPNVMNVAEQVTLRTVARNLVTSQTTILIDRISFLPQVQAECMLPQQFLS